MHLGVSILMALASAAAGRSAAAVHHLWISPSDKLPSPQVSQLSSAFHRSPEVRLMGYTDDCLLSSWLQRLQQDSLRLTCMLPSPVGPIQRSIGPCSVRHNCA